MSTEAAGFWSYVQQDNEGDQGRVLALASDLCDQYRIQTGEKLELFVDRDSIAWGEAWGQRISSAIAGTTFFLPIITPSYFRSNACRQELLKFVREAERLGLEQLLMSVYWVTVPELESSPEESGDEAVRYVAKYQWQNLRDERFEERDSKPYRQAVSALASEIASRVAGVEEVDDLPRSVPAVVATDDGDDEPGIMERIATGEDAMPRITGILEGIGQGIKEVGSEVEAASADLQKASSRGQGMKTALVLTNRLANELSAPVQVIEDKGSEYAKVLTELDPAVHAWLDLVEMSEVLDKDQLEFLEQVEGMAQASDEASASLQELVDAAKTMSTYSRSLRAPVRKMQQGLQGVLDGKAITAEWGKRARGLRQKADE